MERIGSTLNNRYRLEQKIGEGGFAHIFLATDLELNRQVAVKILEQTRDKELLIRFRNEARAVAALDHPNILQIYDFNVSRGTPYIVMPYIRGGTLASQMKQEQLTLDEIGFYLSQIGSALDYAHQHGVIHRDVKPSNLLIRPDGQLLLMDFGLAKLIGSTTSLATSTLLGTVAYMSPEQFQGLVSPASDIYMLGIILYQALTGKLPYEGNTDEVLVGHVYADPKSLVGQITIRSVHPAVVQALDQVVMKVLAKLPTDRYPTCQALTSAYYQALKADPTKAAVGRANIPDVRNLTETILERKQRLLPPTPAEPAKADPYVEETLVLPPDSIPLVPSTQPPSPHLQAPTPATPKVVPDVPLDILAAPESPTPPAGSLGVLPNLPARIPSKPLTPTSGSLDATVIAPKASQHKKRLLKPPRLLVTTEPSRGFHATFELIGEKLTLGRAIDNDLHLPLSIVSRHHAVLNQLSNDPQTLSYKIAQCTPTNPLCFNGQKVPEKVLEHGDTIEIGERGYAEYVVKITYQAAEYS